jgi:hypothetical protein
MPADYAAPTPPGDLTDAAHFVEQQQNGAARFVRSIT